jgi:hypothetical protein
MKKILFLLLITGNFSLVFSQSLNREQKKLQKKSVKVKITDKNGNIHSGYLFGADKNSLVLSSDIYSDSAIVRINNLDIYQIRLLKKQSYGQTFTRNLIVTGVATFIFSVVLFAYSEDSMIGHGIISVLFYTLFGLPANILISTIDKEVVDIDYINRAKSNEEFVLEEKFLKKNSLSNKIPETLNSIDIYKSENKAFSKIIPEKKRHPKIAALIHVTGAYNWKIN